MFNRLIKKHLEGIRKLGYKNNYIFVYKGFPVSFLFELNKNIPFLNKEDQIFTSGKIDLKKIVNNISSLVKKVLRKDKGLHLLIYEEFILLSQKIDLSLCSSRFVVIENNFYSEYPNPSTEHFIDVEHAIEKDHLNFKENELFNFFYVNSVIVENINLVQYRDIDASVFKNIELRPFFDRQVLGSKLHFEEVEEIVDSNIIIFPASKSYLKLKNNIFAGFFLTGQQLLVTDLIILTDKQYEDELKIFQYILKENDVQLKILIKKTTIKHQYRGEFIKILKQYWGSDSFRELIFYKRPDLNSEKLIISQGAVLEEIVKQCELAKECNDFSDIFLTSPTGSGKSVLFQIPAVYIAQKYGLITIVVSPLKALMYDQVRSLKQRDINFVAYINSDIPLIEREKIVKEIKKGETSILYLSPELLLSYDIRNFIGDRGIGLLVIDEAHLVTTWGRDFRVDYWYLGNYIRKLRKYSKQMFPVLALTATAVYLGENDIVFETIESLNMQTPKLYIGNTRREEITFEIKSFEYKKNHELAKMRHTERIIKDSIKNNRKIIVYFPWTTQIRHMMDEMPDKYCKKIGVYYGDVDKIEKQIVMEKFYSGEQLAVLATKAFGMGIDISDIHIVYHHAPSGNLSDYIQEVGRVARSKDIQGIAKVDFCDKDLKFTKILYGLSSIKQYQVRLALQKIWDIYSRHKQQNFLISAEDFGFIFSERDPDKLGGKVKSCLLLLEKDLIKKFKYNVIIVRPKSLYSTVFACVNKEIEENFLKKYGEFCEKVCSTSSNKQYLPEGIISSDVGDVFRIKLNKIWENYFDRDSFPMVKRKFFDEKLFTEFDKGVFPKYKLTIVLKYTKREVLEKLVEYFSILDKAFNKLQGGFFREDTLNSILKGYFKAEILRKKIVNLLINVYTFPLFDVSKSKKYRYDVFIQSKKTEHGEEVYRIIGSAFVKAEHYIIQQVNSMFSTGNNLFDKYLSSSDNQSEVQIKVAHVLEALSLGSYELVGGEIPQIFIRINAPYKLKVLATDPSYFNLILDDIDNRHKESVDIMEKFFTTPMGNTERWDFVENYFLGKKV